jgi:hypothetical protein
MNAMRNRQCKLTYEHGRKTPLAPTTRVPVAWRLDRTKCCQVLLLQHQCSAAVTNLDKPMENQQGWKSSEKLQ